MLKIFICFTIFNLYAEPSRQHNSKINNQLTRQWYEQKKLYVYFRILLKSDFKPHLFFNPSPAPDVFYERAVSFQYSSLTFVNSCKRLSDVNGKKSLLANTGYVLLLKGNWRYNLCVIGIILRVTERTGSTTIRLEW